MICGEASNVNSIGDSTLATMRRCKCWKCDLCGELNKDRVVGMAVSGKPELFVTLTVNPAIGEGPDHRARMLRAAKHEFRRAWRKKTGNKDFPFLAVFEKTKAGEPHIHFLTRIKWIDHAWLSAVMEKQIGAPIVHLRKIDGHGQAAAYVAKYLSKDPERFRGCKRYWSSRGWSVTPSPYAGMPTFDKGSWETDKVRLVDIAMHYHSAAIPYHMTNTRLGTGEFIPKDPP